MVVLAVYVGSDRSPYSNELGPRRHRQEETAGQKILKDFSEADAGFTLQHAGLRIEGEKPVKPCVTDDAASAVQGRIAVATPQPERYEGRLCAGLQDAGQLAPAFGPVDITTLDRETTPAGEGLSYKTFCHSAYSGAFGRQRRRGFHCRLPIADCRLTIEKAASQLPPLSIGPAMRDQSKIANSI
jgi:hypothetical protein